MLSLVFPDSLRQFGLPISRMKKPEKKPKTGFVDFLLYHTKMGEIYQVL
jgi:hypothetical protein